MMKNVLLVCILFVNFLAASAQTQFCRLWHKRSTNFYWDRHEGFDYTVPAGVSKETIYHQKINSRDSAVEKVTWFNRQGFPVRTQYYAAVTNEGIIQTDTFYYGHGNLLINKKSRFLACSNRTDSQSTFFRYDHLDREIEQSNSGRRQNLTATVYDNNKVIKTYLGPTGYTSWIEIHFYNHNREDSMQFFHWDNSWRNTTTYLYDTVQLKKDAYIRYKKGHDELYSREEYNPDGTVKVHFFRWLTNYNNTRDLPVERHTSYNKDKTARECLYFVKGKKAFKKKHYYEYY